MASCAAHFHVTFLEHYSRSLQWPSFQVGQIPGVRSPLGQRNKWASSSICFFAYVLFWVLETRDFSIAKTAVLSLGRKHKRCFHRLWWRSRGVWDRLSQFTSVPDRSLLDCLSNPGSTLSAQTSLQSDACSAVLWELTDKIHNQFQPLHRDRVWYDDDPGWQPPVPLPLLRGLLPCLADLIDHH